MKALLDVQEQLHVSYKTVHSNEVMETAFNSPDFAPFFREPTLYKEVEWMEIPRCCENLFVTNGKSIKRVIEQNLVEMEKIITQVGEFNMEITTYYLRIYAYT